MTKETPYQHHPNCKAHNWLMYKIGERDLMTRAHLIRGTLYDLGCGEAPYRNWILSQAQEYIGVDWSDSAHDITADVVSNLNEPLPIQDESADTVLSLSVLEHLSKPTVMLSEAHRIMKPGGHLLLQVPWQWGVHEAPYDFYRYTPYSLRLLLENSGFINIDITAQAGFFTMLAMKLNYFSSRFIRGPKFLKTLMYLVFIPFWYFTQLVAPLLDTIDRHWDREATGYFIVATKMNSFDKTS